MKKRFRSKLVFSAFTLISISVLGVLFNPQNLVADVPESPAIIEAVLKSWSAREKSVQSFQASWTVNKNNSRYWSTYQSEFAHPEIEKEFPNLNKQTLKYQNDQFLYEAYHWRLSASDEFAGFSEIKKRGPSGKQSHQEYRQAVGNYFDHTVIQTSTPSIYKRFTKPNINTSILASINKASSVAHIDSPRNNSNNKYAWIENAVYRPLLLAFTPQVWMPGFRDIPKWKLLRKQTYVNGSNCVLFDFIISEKRKYRLWLNPEQDYVPIRSVIFHDNKIFEQTDTRYEINENDIWCPVQWKVIICSQQYDVPGRQSIFQFISCDMDKVEINPSLNNEIFEPEILSGTRVYDSIKKQVYLIQPDGSQRILQSHEIANMDKKEQLKNNTFISKKGIRVIIAFVLTISAVLFVILRRKNKQLLEERQ